MNAERRRELYGKLDNAILFFVIAALIVGGLAVLVVSVIERVT